jgi:hypothetical protein
MSQDFFADLERQLVAAAGDRRARLRRARARRVAATAGVLVAVLAAGGGLAAAVTGGDGGGATGTPASTTPAHAVTTTSDPTFPELDTFTTAVLNGTTTPGLARGVANALVAHGAKIGNVTNAATQDHATTAVYYARPDCRDAAARIAESIGRRRSTVRPAPRSLRVVAGREADVIVLVGSDQAIARRP